MVTKQKEKVNEVRHYMLDLFGERLTDEDRNYFIGTFIEGEINGKADLQQRYDFVEKMLCINKDKQSFDGKTLRRVLREHIKVDLYNTVIDKYFSNGYSLQAYGRYFSSGLALKTLPRLEFKMLVKSVLHRS
jgi:hypothetical protein